MFKQNKQRKSVKKGKLYWKEALDWGSTVTISLALASDFEEHQDYLELFSSSLQLTHSLNPHLILSFLYLFRSATSLLCFEFSWLIGLLETLKFIEFGHPKFSKNTDFSIKESWHRGARAASGKSLLSGFSAAATPSKRRNAKMRFRNIALGF